MKRLDQVPRQVFCSCSSPGAVPCDDDGEAASTTEKTGICSIEVAELGFRDAGTVL